MAKLTMTNMKHKTLAAAALAATMMLPSVGAQAANEDLNEVCVDIASLAGNIMDDRQNGVSKAQVTKKTSSDNEAYQTLAKNIIAEAYKVPQAKSAADKDKQVDNFIRQYYNKCAK
ncbi:hypothetical protein [Psychrobacter phenylpyruvicus]|uniref:Uncharacterized protein n=1 Tax=Psychrobacter phenylpyruvicus TaxID=29432 RepID=A0A379LJT2_9GAMM|nr:hypothetical protein [Psychrobacter phenylpyruvicus]SUD90869.1 Uncharacterised protein [Psychrobacter phenylpyruvicus]